jgi:hypothetical protein
MINDTNVHYSTLRNFYKINGRPPPYKTVVVLFVLSEPRDLREL